MKHAILASISATMGVMTSVSAITFGLEDKDAVCFFVGMLLGFINFLGMFLNLYAMLKEE